MIHNENGDLYLNYSGANEISAATLKTHTTSTSNPHSVTKSQVLTGNLIVNTDVDNSAAIAYSKLNIADADLSIAKTSGLSTALSNKLETSLKGAVNGLAELGADGKVPSSQLPSYVDDVIEGYYFEGAFYSDAGHTQLITPEAHKIYMDIGGSNKSYRWSGTVYVVIASDLALGETDATAYRGDRGKTAYDHSQLISGNPHGSTQDDIGNGTTYKQFSATEQTKLSGIETGADVTDVTNVTTALNSINANALADITSAGADIESAVSLKHSQNTDIALRTDKFTCDASGNCIAAGTIKIANTMYHAGYLSGTVDLTSAVPDMSAYSANTSFIYKNTSNTKTWMAFYDGSTNKGVELT